MFSCLIVSRSAAFVSGALIDKFSCEPNVGQILWYNDRNFLVTDIAHRPWLLPKVTVMVMPKPRKAAK